MTAKFKTPVLETFRLVLEPLRLEDAEQVQPLFGQWDVVQYLAAGVPWPYPEGAAHAYYRDVALPAIERGDEWHWTLRLKQEPARIVGAIGLFRGEKNNRGFWIGLPWQGRGLMTEAVEAATAFWFEVLGFDVLRAPKAMVNTASVRISASAGMRLESEQEQAFVCGLLPAQTWVITKDEWLRRRDVMLRSQG